MGKARLGLQSFLGTTAFSPSKYFSILVVINHCLSSLHLCVNEIACGLDFGFL